MTHTQSQSSSQSSAADAKTYLLLSQGRLFLSQLNVIPMNDQGTIELLKNTGSSLNRAIQHLDKCPVRETVKIGVVYVGLNQKHQRDILHNSKPGSDEFEQFVGALGWPVDLSSHKGFSGGLDCNADKLSCSPIILIQFLTRTGTRTLNLTLTLQTPMLILTLTLTLNP
jgi:hypothetical protein